MRKTQLKTETISNLVNHIKAQSFVKKKDEKLCKPSNEVCGLFALDAVYVALKVTRWKDNLADPYTDN